MYHIATDWRWLAKESSFGGMDLAKRKGLNKELLTSGLDEVSEQKAKICKFDSSSTFREI